MDFFSIYMEYFTYIEKNIDMVGLIVLLVATPILVVVIHNVLLSKAARHWPKVNGTIIDNPIMLSVQQYGMEYEYEVSGITYRNRRVFYSNIDAYSLSLAIEFDKKYAKNQIVDVFYNPKNPQQAVLEPGRTDGAFLGATILGMMVTYGVVTVFVPNSFAQFIDGLFYLFN